MLFSKRQLEPLIEKFGINTETNTLFKRIIEMFDGQTNYQIWAVKAIFSQNLDMQSLKSIVEFIKEFPTSIKLLQKKNITSYTSSTDIGRLMDEIRSIKAIVFVKSTIANFNTEQRKMLHDVVIKPISKPYESLLNSAFKDWHDLFYKFNKLPWARKDKFFKTASAIRDVNSLRHQICTCLEDTYDWELGKDDLLSLIENNAKDCEVVYNKDNVVIVKVPSFESSVKLCGGGRTQWCISRDEGNFTSYCKDSEGKRTQYFLFDFSRKESDVFSHIGFTTLKGYGVVEAQTGNNMPMLKQKYRQKTEEYDIYNIFDKFNIPMSLVLGIKQHSEFLWEKDSLMSFIKKTFGDIETHFLDGNKVLVKIEGENRSIFKRLICNTNLSKDMYTERGTYILFDFDLPWDDNNAVIAFNTIEDEYGDVSTLKTLNQYGADVDFCELDKRVKPSISDTFFKSKLEPNILFHKYIDKGLEDKAIALILEENVDVNFENNFKVPVFSAIANGMVRLFDLIVKNNNFDDKVVDGLGESLLHTLIILLGTKESHCVVKGGKETLVSAIESILDSPYYDLNQVDANGDTPIKLSCRWEETAWVTQMLASKPQVDVNYGGTDNESPLSYAIHFNNTKSIAALLNRSDLNISKTDLKKIQVRMGTEPVHVVVSPSEKCDTSLIF